MKEITIQGKTLSSHVFVSLLPSASSDGMRSEYTASRAHCSCHSATHIRYGAAAPAMQSERYSKQK